MMTKRFDDEKLRVVLVLLREAIDCPFEKDHKKWKAWCAQWRPRAEKLIRECGE